MGLIETLQDRYEGNRARETWGSPSGSPDFFNDWEKRGFLVALKNFVHMHEGLGTDRFSPQIKAGMALMGGAILATGIFF